MPGRERRPALVVGQEADAPRDRRSARRRRSPGCAARAHAAAAAGRRAAPVTMMPSTRLPISDSTCWASRAGSSVALHMKTAIRWSERHSSSPSMIGMEKRPKLSVEISPTVRLCPRCRLWARSFGRKPSSLATAITLSRVSCRRLPLLLSAFETVPTLTSASRATSRMVEPRAAAAAARRRRGLAASLRSLSVAFAHFTAPLRKPET